MATLILSTVGTLIGGPLGGAIGALVGRQVDAMVIGGRKVEGPRLKELSVQTSSYGSALPLHFGRMRAAGSVIWATELVEHKETSGGGKGAPSITSYTYSASFAVAVASRPIAGIGRVWADGNLLRGAAGDLKVGGTMRVHSGHGDQPQDPLLAQAEGATRCPAYRHCAYVVFEDLQLADYGNRLPSLTFEILADTGDCTIGSILHEILPEATAENLDITFAGFTIDQGTPGDTLSTLSQAVPLACATAGERLIVRPADAAFPAIVPTLPLPAASEDSHADKARIEGWSRRREPLPRTRQCGLRYYDIARDYQPGLQRGIGRSEQGELTMIELPAALSADAARVIANDAGRRASRPGDTISYRTTEIDPTLAPGAFVRLPVASGVWRIDQWEWQKDGVLLELSACLARDTQPVAASTVDAGRVNEAADLVAPPTVLQAFELPWDGTGSSTTPALFAAASAMTAGWTGAALFAQPEGGAGALVRLGTTGRDRTIVGRTGTALAPASPLLVDRASTVDVHLAGTDLALASATLTQLLQGANRARIGSEVIQFASAERIGDGVWRLAGLLRGRGGTEWAIGSHGADEPFALIGNGLTRLDSVLVGDAASTQIVAVGLGDPEAIIEPIAGEGTTLRPLSPVHGRAKRLADGGIRLDWIRRARGAWAWPDAVDTPLNEESELWEVAYGDTSAPALRWQMPSASLTISATQASSLSAIAVPAQFNIRQLGRGAPSFPLTLAVPA